MESLRKMRPLEKDFQRFVSLKGADCLDHVLSHQEYEDSVNSAGPSFSHLLSSSLGEFAPRIGEGMFFLESEDVSAVQHLRYMPALYHVGDFFELECILSGEITCYVIDQRLTLREGDVLILAPRTSHAACVFSEEGIMVNVLVRKSTFEKRFLDLMPASHLLKGFFEKALYRAEATPYLLFHTGDALFLQSHILPLLRECEHTSRYRNTALVSLLQLFFVALLRSHEKDVFIPTMDASVMNEETIFILEYMQNNLSTITLSHLAEFFNYSERQIQRIIHSATGMSFGENVKKLKMDRAKELLTNPNLKISDIAEYLGYSDVSSFRHAFRTALGRTPQEYRRESLEKKDLKEEGDEV